MNDLNPITLIVGAVFGGSLGYVCGMIPQRAAKSRNREDLASASQLTCTIVGAAGGCITALPVALIFWAVIAAMGNAPRHRDEEDEQAPDLRRRGRRPDQTPPPARPYTEIGNLVVCAACQMATGKTDGAPPIECPHCHHRFAPRIAYPRKRPADEEIVSLEVADTDRRRW